MRTRDPAPWAAVFGSFDVVLAQDDASAQRLTQLGARDDGRLNLKLAGDPLPVDIAALKALKAASGKRPILLAASTHDGDEAMTLAAYAKADPGCRALLVIAPRHPARAQAVVDLARDEGFTAALQSEAPFGQAEGFRTGGCARPIRPASPTHKNHPFHPSQPNSIRIGTRATATLRCRSPRRA